MNVTTKRGKVVSKPSTIVDYNSAKGFIDISDQRASYSSPVRKGLKWYRKVAVELLANTSVVNAYLMYTTVEKKEIDITKFREELILGLLEKNKDEIQDETDIPSAIHKIVSTAHRSRCATCYETIKNMYGQGHAMKFSEQVKTVCPGCDDKSALCTEFFNKHLIDRKK